MCSYNFCKIEESHRILWGKDGSRDQPADQWNASRVMATWRTSDRPTLGHGKAFKRRSVRLAAGQHLHPLDADAGRLHPNVQFDFIRLPAEGQTPPGGEYLYSFGVNVVDINALFSIFELNQKIRDFNGRRVIGGAGTHVTIRQEQLKRQICSTGLLDLKIDKVLQHFNRGVVHSQIRCTDFKS